MLLCCVVIWNYVFFVSDVCRVDAVKLCVIVDVGFSWTSSLSSVVYIVE